MRKILILCFSLFVAYSTFAQLPASIWKGHLTQTGGQDTFAYELHLIGNGQQISGTAYSTNPQGGNARFAVRGSWDGQQLLLQELKQEMPAKPKWCLKYLKLNLQNDATGKMLLKGDWQAQGCRPGTLSLFPIDPIQKEETSMSRFGRWTGHLDQSDRAYGFFYTIDLGHDGKGTSSIVSEASGGTATHELDWTWDSSRQVITIIESKVLEKTDPNWPWCIKRAELSLEQFSNRQVISGDWSGFIEGFSKKGEDGGACAAGKMYLEKPIVYLQAKQRVESESIIYEKNEGRKVRVDRVLQVSSPNLRLKIWDNGTVDGDIVTIFLNGDQLVNKFRVSKRKYGIPVTLTAKENLLIIHAEDLGDITPNTVAVSIDDGTKEEVLVISSDLRVSGGILIQPFEFKGEE